MRKRQIYTEDEKQNIRRLLIIHAGDVGVVHGLTKIPRRTLYGWRTEWNDDYGDYLDILAQKINNRANAAKRAEARREALDDNDSDSANTGGSFAQFTQLREILMEHLMTLSTNLLVGDEFVNQRTIAITRLLDRILELDDILPSQNPEQVMRIEYYYDDAVHDVPPWKGASEGYVPPSFDDYEG